MAAKRKQVTVVMITAAGSVYQWRADEATVHINRDGKAFLNVYNSEEAGTFGIEIPRGGQVEVRP